LGSKRRESKTRSTSCAKQSHYWDVLKKDALACRQLSTLAAKTRSSQAKPGFDAEYQAELAKRGLKRTPGRLRAA
jgi:hypothetical protein